jgi:hypothetical protein
MVIGCIHFFAHTPTPYGSQEFLRTKKNLSPITSERSILRGFSLSFPAGRGFDLVEPSFATTKVNPDDLIHGVSTLFTIKDAVSLNSQEAVGSAYNLEVHKVLLYDGVTELDVEVYVPAKPLPLEFPEGECSTRYRDILVTGAKEAGLDEAWIQKLESLPVYTPSTETLAKRQLVPPVSSLPRMTIAELAQHNGSSEAHPHYISSCGYIFRYKDFFTIYHGRDITFRNCLQRRGINLDSNDDGGKSPFPRLSRLEPEVLEYALQYRDRFIHKAGIPIAVLAEFWQEQDASLEGVYSGNILSKL